MKRVFNLILVSSVISTSVAQAAAVRCEALFQEVQQQTQRGAPVNLEALKRDPREAWDLTREAILQLRLRFENSDYVLHPLLSAIISKEFAWLNGDPGGAKTLISRSVFEAELRSLSREDKRIFMLQFHKLLNEGVITGFPKLKDMLDTGEYKRNYEDSLISDKFIFMVADEVEKATPALQTTLLSVLNERKAFLGSQVVDTLLISGVFTSNKSIGELVDSAGEERAAIEALVDRMAIKVHVANQTLDALASQRMRNKIDWSRRNPWNGASGAMHLSGLVKNVKIPAELLEEMVHIVRMMDSLYMTKLKEADQSRNTNAPKAFFPPNQFSNRSIVKLIQTWKAAFIARQLMEGKSFDEIRYQMTASDMRDLAVGALLNAPGSFRAKSTPITMTVIDPDIGIPIHKIEDAAFEPSTGRVSFKKEDGAVYSMTLDLANQKVIGEDSALSKDGRVIKISQFFQMAEVFKAAQAAAKSNKDLVGIEEDSVLSQFLAAKTLPSRTRVELDFVHESRDTFVNLVNLAVQKYQGKALDYNLKNEASVTARLELERKGQELTAIANEVRSGKRKMTEIEFTKLAIVSLQQSYRELSADYRELEHSIRAHMLSVLARTHILAYGPPGGAKTSLARTVLTAVLDSSNKSALSPVLTSFETKVMAKYRTTLDDMKKRGEKYQEYELFFRQFHKMVPEGEIVGFPKLNDQLNTGKLAYDRTQSLSHERFLMAILDEVEKGNPALLQTLLSILNEREVFAGHEIVKASLSTAVLTSNKVPSEFLDSFGDDKPAGLALMDRTANKVFVPNKFADDATMVTMLKDIESGTFNPRLASPLMLLEMQPLLAQVEIPSRVELFVLDVMKQWQAKRLEREEQTFAAHEADPRDNPNYYVPASKPSNRTENTLMDQLKASWLLQASLDGRLIKMIEAQEKEGKALNQMKFEVTFEDASLISQGLLLWGPYAYKVTHNAQGELQFELADNRLQNLINSPGTSERLAYQLTMIQEEARDLQTIMNQELMTTIKSHRELIAKYPELFPGMFNKRK